MTETWEDLLQQLLVLLGKIVERLIQGALAWSLLIVWLALSLWGINWKKVWPILAQGAWMPLVLVMILAALVWSQMVPGEFEFLGLWVIPNFWRQLGEVCLIVAVTFFCGWLQGFWGWEPAEMNLEPPEAVQDHAGH